MNQDLNTAVGWFPGHMVTAMRKMAGYLKLIDIVVEVIDARAARSDANPALDALIENRTRIVVLSRDDLADGATTKRWLEYFSQRHFRAIAVEARAQQSVSRILAEIVRAAKARTQMSRVIVVGLPNSGKSSVINGLLKRGAARTEDRAGVTRQLQWFRLAPTIELMDTPGILVPKIYGAAQWKLSMIGAVPRERYDPEEVVAHFHAWLVEHRAGRTAVPDLMEFARSRGIVRRGGEVDVHNAAQSYIRAFNDGSFGRISFESPDDQLSEQTT